MRNLLSDRRNQIAGLLLLEQLGTETEPAPKRFRREIVWTIV